MNKEIRNYQESMFMGLNLRQCIFSLFAILVAVGIYFGLGDYVGQEMTGWLCILGAAPFAACGFFQYHGMNAEQFAWAYLKSEFLYPKRLLFQSEDLYHACMEETLALGEKTQGDGTALMKKREQRAMKKQMKQKKKSGRSGAFDSDRNASSIVNDCYGIIFIYRYLDGITIPRKSFINCIIYNLINQMMKTSGRCTADIHTRSLSYSLKTFQYLNLICTVFCIALCAHSNLLSFLFILRKQHRLQHEKLCSTETCFL